MKRKNQSWAKAKDLALPASSKLREVSRTVNFRCRLEPYGNMPQGKLLEGSRSAPFQEHVSFFQDFTHDHLRLHITALASNLSVTC